mmetsp:Transcript_9575/g.28822  ORF Transcript_9575/g.28822 Transcript_9575/m.28822 type:complete len:201 (-) Transcript_9575:1175-1777(-)
MLSAPAPPPVPVPLPPVLACHPSPAGPCPQPASLSQLLAKRAHSTPHPRASARWARPIEPGRRRSTVHSRAARGQGRWHICHPSLSRGCNAAPALRRLAATAASRRATSSALPAPARWGRPEARASAGIAQPHPPPGPSLQRKPLQGAPALTTAAPRPGLHLAPCRSTCGPLCSPPLRRPRCLRQTSLQQWRRRQGRPRR